MAKLTATAEEPDDEDAQKKQWQEYWDRFTAHGRPEFVAFVPTGVVEPDDVHLKANADLRHQWKLLKLFTEGYSPVGFEDLASRFDLIGKRLDFLERKMREVRAAIEDNKTRFMMSSDMQDQIAELERELELLTKKRSIKKIATNAEWVIRIQRIKPPKT